MISNHECSDTVDLQNLNQSHFNDSKESISFKRMPKLKKNWRSHNYKKLEELTDKYGENFEVISKHFPHISISELILRYYKRIKHKKIVNSIKKNYLESKLAVFKKLNKTELNWLKQVESIQSKAIVVNNSGLQMENSLTNEKANLNLDSSIIQDQFRIESTIYLLESWMTRHEVSDAIESSIILKSIDTISNKLLNLNEECNSNYQDSRTLVDYVSDTSSNPNYLGQNIKIDSNQLITESDIKPQNIILPDTTEIQTYVNINDTIVHDDLNANRTITSQNNLLINNFFLESKRLEDIITQHDITIQDLASINCLSFSKESALLYANLKKEGTDLFYRLSKQKQRNKSYQSQITYSREEIDILLDLVKNRRLILELLSKKS